MDARVSVGHLSGWIAWTGLIRESVSARRRQSTTSEVVRKWTEVLGK
jgi:hypothetical protein